MNTRPEPALPALEPYILHSWGDVRAVVFPLQGCEVGSLPEWDGVGRFTALDSARPERSEPPVHLERSREVPPLWLGPNERKIFESFPYEPRAREWLAGRRATKALLWALKGIPFHELEILPADTDAPVIHINGKARKDLSVSISHTQSYVAAAVSECAVGVDLCDIADGRRIQRIAGRVFNPGEADATGALESDVRGATVWALKEAGLKLDIGGVFQPGARSIQVQSLDPVRLQNPKLNAEAWRLPKAVLALAVHHNS